MAGRSRTPTPRRRSASSWTSSTAPIRRCSARRPVGAVAADDPLLQRELRNPARRSGSVPVRGRSVLRGGSGLVAARPARRLRDPIRAARRPSGTRTPTRLRTLSSVSSTRAPPPSAASSPAASLARSFEREARRYAREELAWLARTGRRRWIPYAAVYELGKFAGVQLGARHRRLPLWLKQRCSFFPAYWEYQARRERSL